MPSIVQPAGAYSHGVVVSGLLFTCGMGPKSAGSNHVPLGGIEDQTRRTLKNLEQILAAECLDFSHVVKMSAYLADLERDFVGYDAVCRDFFKEPFPVRTTVGMNMKEILISVELVAQL